MLPKQFTQFDLDTVERLTALETRLKHVESTLNNFEDNNNIRLTEIKNLIVSNNKTRALPIIGKFIGKNWKLLIIPIGLAFGLSIPQILALWSGF